jgi:hypothetical protein
MKNVIRKFGENMIKALHQGRTGLIFQAGNFFLPGQKLTGANDLVISKGRNLMHLKKTKYACTYALKNLQICS